MQGEVALAASFSSFANDYFTLRADFAERKEKNYGLVGYRFFCSASIVYV